MKVTQTIFIWQNLLPFLILEFELLEFERTTQDWMDSICELDFGC